MPFKTTERVRAKNARWYKKNIERERLKRRLNRLRALGLPSEQLTLAKKAVETFDGHCQCCGELTTGVIDHDYVKRVFRGVLCGPCNRTLGHSEENIQRLRMSIVYLARFA